MLQVLAVQLCRKHKTLSFSFSPKQRVYFYYLGRTGETIVKQDGGVVGLIFFFPCIAELLTVVSRSEYFKRAIEALYIVVVFLLVWAL